MNNKIIKKRVKIMLVFLATIVVLGVIFGIVDYNRAKQNKAPLFAIRVNAYYDGGSKEYYGLGYKVIECNTLSGDDSIHIGFYNIKVDKNCKNGPIDFEKINEKEVDNFDREHEIDQNINLNELNTLEQKAMIGKLIKEKVNKDFVLDDYIVGTSEPEANDSIVHVIYDFNFTIAGVRTNLAYSVFVNGERTKVESIFDNTKGYNLISLKKENEEMIKTKLDKFTEKKKEEIRRRALKAFEKPNYSLEIADEYPYFKVENKELVFMIFVVGRNNDHGAMFANIYEEKI
ncbi:MAG TPA: hypothetical protein GXZ95_01740 [Mollicutes bacterium]|nr:hypothetical protein [Mollicutes bacterium]